jgi:hypothetical protein
LVLDIVLEVSIVNSSADFDWVLHVQVLCSVHCTSVVVITVDIISNQVHILIIEGLKVNLRTSQLIIEFNHISVMVSHILEPEANLKFF